MLLVPSGLEKKKKTHWISYVSSASFWVRKLSVHNGKCKYWMLASIRIRLWFWKKKAKKERKLSHLEEKLFFNWKFQNKQTKKNTFNLSVTCRWPGCCEHFQFLCFDFYFHQEIFMQWCHRYINFVLSETKIKACTKNKSCSVSVSVNKGNYTTCDIFLRLKNMYRIFCWRTQHNNWDSSGDKVSDVSWEFSSKNGRKIC